VGETDESGALEALGATGGAAPGGGGGAALVAAAIDAAATLAALVCDGCRSREGERSLTTTSTPMLPPACSWL
jgi:hypothetical protein